MAAIKGKDTKPEMIVRQYLFSKGLRYRVNARKLPESPDIVLKKYKTVVFIDGCFWHGHEECKYFRLPKSNVDFWRHKIAMNIARDYANNVDLKLAGWRVIRILECEIRTKAKHENVLKHLYGSITQSYNKENYQSNKIDNKTIDVEPNIRYGELKILRQGKGHFCHHIRYF